MHFQKQTEPLVNYRFLTGQTAGIQRLPHKLFVDHEIGTHDRSYLRCVVALSNTHSTQEKQARRESVLVLQPIDKRRIASSLYFFRDAPI